MKRYFRFGFTVLAMIATALIFTMITLRVTLHAGETVVPNFASLTVSEASDLALKAGLDLTIENKFYSVTVPPGRILSQAPAPGSKVRQGWQVRVTESLGPQQVTIPDVTGEVLREASMNLRRNQLDLGELAHLDAPGDPDLVLAQTPPPDAGVDQPRVSLLLSSAGTGASSAFVLPSFSGLSWHEALKATAALGLRAAYLGETTTTAVAPPTPAATSAGTTPDSPSAAPAQSAATPSIFGPSGPVLSQTPPAGFRANRGDTVKLTFAHVTLAVAAPAATTPATPAAPPPQ
jgi:beta-lactam-binding protein with PASTA domain